MGLDVGQRTIGVSVSDEFGWTAQSLEVIRREEHSTDKEDQRLAQLIKQYEVGHIIVGLPKHMNGTIGDNGRQCQQFAQRIEVTYGLPVHLWDERLSTRAAQNILLQGNVSRKKRKKVIDQLAATIILQGYLDSLKRDNDK